MKTQNPENQRQVLNKRLSVYYFKGQDFCINPREIRDDMSRFRDAAVDSVCVGFHEGELAGGNLEMVAAEVERAGLDLWAVPSRIGALVAGWHRAVGYLSAHHPELWARHPDGNPISFFGPQISVHHPESLPEFIDVVERMLDALPIKGIIWDELKSLDIADHSEAAIKSLGRPGEGEAQVEATARFFSSVNASVKRKRPDLQIALFLYCFMEDDLVRVCSEIEGLDEFGCDGACLRIEDDCKIEGGPLKKLLPDNYARFAKAAHARNRRGFVLVETQNQELAATAKSFDRHPELLALDPEHLVYYDYPRKMENSAEFQPRLAEVFKRWRGI